MSLNRTLFCLALAIASWCVLAGEGQAFTVCRTPDGSTYASDNPPADCAPIPSAEIERFGAYGDESRAAVPRPEPAVAPQPSLTEEQPAIPIDPRRTASDEAPGSDRTHAI